MVTKLIKWISKHILLAPLMLLLLFMSYGCKSVEYIPVESVKIDSLYFNKFMHDSIVIHDSVYIKDKGDTIYQFKYKYIFKDRVMTDTAYIERTDTIRIPYPVEAKLSRWQQLKIDMGGYSLALGLFIMLIVFGNMKLKYESK